MSKDMKAFLSVKEQADGEGLHHRGDHDVLDHPERTGAIQSRRLHDLGIDAHDAGDIDQHHVARLLPDRDDDQRPQRQIGVGKPAAAQQRQAERLAHGHEHAIEHELPDQAENDAANQVGQKEGGPEKSSTANFRRDNQRQAERDDVGEDQDPEDIGECQEEQLTEAFVRKGFLVICPANETGHVEPVPVGER